jgi:hypothetical protein
MLKRPKTWSRKKDIFITEGSYDMEIVHKYVKRCLKGTSADVKKIKIRTGLIKEGYLGLSVFEKKEIWLDNIKDSITFYITLFHEIFHNYFRDYGDERKNRPEDDFIEFRAEKSAVNMLKWYVDNLDKLEEIKYLVAKLEIKDLTQVEKDII